MKLNVLLNPSIINFILNFIAFFFSLYRIKDPDRKSFFILLWNIILMIFMIECIFNSHDMNWNSKFKYNHSINKLVGY